MKQKLQKNFNKQLFKQKTLILLLFSAQNSFGSITNNNINTHTQNNIKNQIQIYSNYQNIDMMTNTVAIAKNVVIQTNTINIYADKVFITYLNKNNKEKKIDAYGNPVIFYQFKKNKKQILATSLYMSYTTYNDTLILKGDVYFKQKNYTLHSNCITYMIKNKYITTCHNYYDPNQITLTFNTNN